MAFHNAPWSAWSSTPPALERRPKSTPKLWVHADKLRGCRLLLLLEFWPVSLSHILFLLTLAGKRPPENSLMSPLLCIRSMLQEPFRASVGSPIFYLLTGTITPYPIDFLFQYPYITPIYSYITPIYIYTIVDSIFFFIILV